jgi:hypothetical protein
MTYMAILSHKRADSVYSVDTLDKEMIHAPSGMSKISSISLRVVYNLKFMNFLGYYGRVCAYHVQGFGLNLQY